jgi:hypothetical protein
MQEAMTVTMISVPLLQLRAVTQFGLVLLLTRM